MTALLALALAAAPGCPAALAEAHASPDPAALARAAPAIVGRLQAAGPGGATSAVKRAADVALAAAPDPEACARAAARFLRTLERHCALAAELPLPGATPADRAALDTVLARPEFSRARVDTAALRRLLLGLWAEVLDLLGTREAERWAGLGRALFALAAAAAVAMGVAALRRRRRGLRPAAAAVRPEVPAPPDASAASAHAALSRGDAPAAVRHALLAALGALEEARWLPRGRALTNAEAAAALARAEPTSSPSAAGQATPRAAAAASGEFRELASTFDRAVYGGRPVGLGDARVAVERAGRIAALASEGRR